MYSHSIHFTCIIYSKNIHVNIKLPLIAYEYCVIVHYSNIKRGVKMDEQFIRESITQLRIAANKSEREMSLDLGHSGSYINSITSGRTFPSLKEFLYICEYLNITPEYFFQTTEDLSPIKIKAISQLIKMDDDNVSLLSELMDRLSESNK